MTARSLRLRLLTLAAGAIGVALLLAWAGLALLFERHVERGLADELERRGAALAAAVSVDAAGRPALAVRPFDPRFEVPGSGLYWRIDAPGGAIASRSLWDGRLVEIEAPAETWARATTAGPFEAQVVTVARTVRPNAGGPAARIAVAADHAVVVRARDAFAGELAAFLGLLFAALMAAAAVQVGLGLAPLAAVTRALDGLRADPAARLDASAHPSEIAPLADAINDLADARARDMTAARARAGDLAHALKTPLTALRLQVEALPAADRAGFAQSLALLGDAVGHELARTSVAALDARGSVEIGPLIGRLAEVVRRARADRAVTIEVDVAPGAIVPMSEAAALEAFGALIDNAVRHAASIVRVRAEAGVVAVFDDGPGIAPQDRAAALARGVRLDQTGGHGLGLAVAADLVAASGGALILDAAPGGGLAATARWSEDGRGR